MKKYELASAVSFDNCSAFESLLAFYTDAEKAHECTVKLIEKYGSFSTVLSENEDELCRVGNINKNTATLIKLVAYLNSRRVTERFETGKEYSELDLRELIGALFLGSTVETVYLILFDDKDKLISWEYMGEGTVGKSDVYPRKLLECAVKKKAKKIVLAHNHPKGNVTPSTDDVMTTGRLFNIFSSVGVRLSAHYIVADGKVGRIEADMLYNPDFKG